MATKPEVTYSDIGGNDIQKQEVTNGFKLEIFQLRSLKYCVFPSEVLRASGLCLSRPVWRVRETPLNEPFSLPIARAN